MKHMLTLLVGLCYNINQCLVGKKGVRAKRQYFCFRTQIAFK